MSSLKVDVLVAHPGKHHVLHLVAGCIKSGKEVLYVTPFYRAGIGRIISKFPGKIGSKSRGYFHPEIPLKNIQTSFFWQFKKSMYVFANKSYEKVFDEIISRKIRKGFYQAKVLITLQDYMPKTVFEAKKLGWKIWSDQILNRSIEALERIEGHERKFGLMSRKENNEEFNDDIISLADVITVPSEYTLSGIKKIITSKVSVRNIPYGASEYEYSMNKTKIKNEIVILARANSIRKGGHIFLKALEKSASHLVSMCHPRRVKVIIMGNLEKVLLELYDELKFPENMEVIFGDVPHEEVSILYEKASLFIMPSLSEGMSLACIEAMHAGLPLIITKYCGIDNFKNGLMGYEVDELDESFSEILINVFENEKHWAQWGKAAKEFAESLTWNAYEDKISDLTRELLC